MPYPTDLRFRDRNDIRESIANTREWDDIPTPITGGDVSYTKWRNYQIFRDRSNLLANPGKPDSFGVGPCYNWSIRYKPPGELALWRRTQFTGPTKQYYEWYGNASYLAPDILLNDLFPSNFVGVSPIQRLSLALDAWDDFHQQIPEELSLPNFIYELKDMKTYLDSFMALPASTRESIKRALKKKKSPSELNQLYLEYNFSISPFLGDILKLLDSLKIMWTRLEWLNRNRGQPVKMKFRRKNVGMTSDAFRTYLDSIQPFNLALPFWREGPTFALKTRFLSNVASCSSEYYASGTLLQELDGLSDNLTTLRGLFALLGFNNPAKVIWNAIPFSFVLDWFIPLGKGLNVMAAQPFAGVWRVYNVTSTVKTVLSCKVEQELFHEGGSPPITNTKYSDGELSMTYYTRQLGLPISQLDVGFSELNLKQQTLFYSLLAGLTIFNQSKKG